MADSEGFLMNDEVDLVYTWCDSADPVWNAKRLATARACGLSADAPANASCRFSANDELKYSLRSAEKCVPWVRKVFLVIDDDSALPVWLRPDHPKIRIVRHSEIMPREYLPCFCSGTIEHHLARIPDLAEKFVYSNDDMMFYRPLAPSFFFAADGYPLFRFGRKKAPVPDGKMTNYYFNLEQADLLIRKEFGSCGGELALARSRYPHHCIDAYRKSDMLECHERFAPVLKKSFLFPFRSPDKVQRVIYACEAIARGHGHFRQSWSGIGRRPWYKRLLRPGWADSLRFGGNQWRTGPRMLAKWRPGMFCFNDTDGITDEDKRWLNAFCDELYPAPSGFERGEP